MIKGGAIPFVYYRIVTGFNPETADTRAIYQDTETGKIYTHDGTSWNSIQDEMISEIIKTKKLIYYDI